MRRIMFLLIIGLAGLGVLLALGFWQVQRLDQKQAIIARIDARVSEQPVALPASPDPAKHKYLAVTASGDMTDRELHVLISRQRVGAGYRIISAFELADGRRILVDRGFTLASRKSDDRRLGPMQIIGNLHWPDETDGFTPEPDLAENIWFARDVSAMAKALNSDPVMIIANARNDPAIVPMPVESSAIPNNHLQYAITWFLLALVWSAMAVFFLWRTRAKTESNKT